MTVARALIDGDYDVVVVGGGMAGAGAARDLAMRGLTVALVDKGDFASAVGHVRSGLVAMRRAPPRTAWSAVWSLA